MKIKKTLIITKNCFPPVIVGPAVLLGNLFRRFDGNYCVLMGNLQEEYRLIDESFWFPCKYYFTNFPGRPRSGWCRSRSLLTELKLVMKSTIEGIEIVRHENINNIFLISGYLEPLTALLIHWITRKRLVVYLPDIYYVPNRFGSGWSTFFMRLIEPVLLRSAHTVIVTAEPTQEYYKKKYDVDAFILPHSVELEKYQTQCPAYNLKEKKEIKILFTGEVSEAQLDSILNMVKTVNTYTELNATFVVAANASKEIVDTLGIRGPRVVVTHANRDEIPAVQQSADILFLPLSFTWTNPEIIRTASPSKMPEYLAAGRPILVHAPPYSYIAKYARSERFALVVDQPDCDKLHQAILELRHNKNLCHELVINARRAAESHDSVTLAARLKDIFQ